MIGQPPHASGAKQRCPNIQAQKGAHPASMILALLCTIISAEGHDNDHTFNGSSFDIGGARYALNVTSNDTNNLVLWEHQNSHLANEVEQDLGANIATVAANGTILDGDLDSAPDATKLILNEGVILANRLARSMAPRLNITVFTYSKTLPVFHIDAHNDYTIPLGRGEVQMKIAPDASFMVSPGPYRPFKFVKGDLGNTLPGDVGVFEFARGPPAQSVITLTIASRRGKKLPKAHVASFKESLHAVLKAKW